MNMETITNDNKCNALVVEGGAMRGIFSTGVLDAFLEKTFNPFDIFIGVSAGATNIAGYLAGMYQRNLKVYTDYSLRPDFINWKKFIRGGHLVDIDWLWDITIKEIRLNLEEIFNRNRDYYVGITDISTGKTVYLRPDKNNLEEITKASSAIPIFYRKFIKLNGIEFADGGVADPIPVIEAYRRGAKNIMVIRSRPYSYTMKPNSNHLFSKLYLKKYPGLINAIKNRARTYQEAIDFIRNPPDGIRVFEINPPETFQTKRLTKDISILKQDYKCGYDIGMDIVKQWNYR